MTKQSVGQTSKVPTTSPASVDSRAAAAAFGEEVKKMTAQALTESTKAAKTQPKKS